MEGETMQLSSDEISVLLQIQQLDLNRLQVDKKFEKLPQRATIMNVRAKRRVIETKQEAVNQMRKAAEEKASAIEDEDAKLAEKAQKIQSDIDNAQGDFRNLEKRTKELDGVAKRRRELEGELSKASEELLRVEAVQAQVDAALGQLEATEKQATEVFVKEGGACRNEAARLAAESAKLKASLPAEVQKAYDKAAAHAGGVGIARLKDDGTCSACRAPIDHGRVLDLKRKGNVGSCPNCQRLLVL